MMAYRLCLFIAMMMCPVLLCAKAAPEPRWIAAELPAPAEEPTRFLRTFHLAHAPARTWVRVHAHDRYRLIVNAHPVSVGDTTWDAETYDISSFATVGTNRIEIAADADTQSPANCFVWLRRRLSVPAAFERLSFRTRDARREEWLYIEVVDDKGRTSGFYCVERRGATCFAVARLCPERVRRQAEKRPARVKDRKGAWIVLDGFRPEDLGPHEASLPPVGDAMRLVFKGREVRVK